MGETCSVCGVAVAGASMLYAPDGRIVCPKCFDNLAPVAVGGTAPWRTFGIAGVVAGSIPFAVNVSSASSTMVNGEVTSFVYRDWIAVVCGVIAIVLGGITLAAARKEQLQRALAIAMGAAVVVLGGVQIARGFGVFATPGSGASASSSTSISIDTRPSPAAAVDEPAAPKGDPKSPTTCPDAQTCFDLGLALEKSAPADSTTAFARACELGASGGCFNAGFDLSHRDPPEIAKAIPFFQKACDAKDPNACNELGRIAATGDGGATDYALAKTMFEKACDGGHALGCSNLGVLHANGYGVKEDAAKARALFEKGCQGGDGGGCFKLAELRAHGRGGKKDPAGAAAAYKAACDAGVQDGCAALAHGK